MTERIPLAQHTKASLDALYEELAALRQVARGYCPACGRGDAAPTVADWEQQRQRADRLAAALRQLLDQTPNHAVRKDDLQRWRDILDGKPAPASRHDDGPSVAECAKADRVWPLQKAGE